MALGEPMDANDLGGAWAMRIYYKPFIRWLWAGGLFMMLGGFVAAADRRFRVRRKAEAGEDETAKAPLATTRESHA